MKNIDDLWKLAPRDRFPIHPHAVAVVLDAVMPDKVSGASFLEIEDRGLGALAALAHEDALRQAYHGPEFCILQEQLPERLGAVLIPGEEAFGNYNGATSSFLKQFKHQFYEEDGRFRFFGMLFPDVGIGRLIPLGAEGRIGDDDGFGIPVHRGVKHLQRISLFDVLRVQAADVHVDCRHLADHAQVFDSADACPIEGIDNVHGGHIGRCFREVLLKKSLKFRMGFNPRPFIFPGYLFQDILKSVEQEAAGPASRIKDDI